MKKLLVSTIIANLTLVSIPASGYAGKSITCSGSWSTGTTATMTVQNGKVIDHLYGTKHVLITHTDAIGFSGPTYSVTLYGRPAAGVTFGASYTGSNGTAGGSFTCP